MICVIREASYIMGDSEETKDCLEAECAWWIKETKFSEGMCALKKIATDLVVKTREAK